MMCYTQMAIALHLSPLYLRYRENTQEEANQTREPGECSTMAEVLHTGLCLLGEGERCLLPPSLLCKKKVN